MIATSSRFILFLGKTVWGGLYQDFSLLKEDFEQKAVFEDYQVWVDLAYLGFSKYYKTQQLHIPHKKPRKSKNNPDPKLTEQQKEANKEKSSVRVVVEHAIAGMKRYKILTEKFRNKSQELADQVVEVCAGLWNYKLCFGQ